MRGQQVGLKTKLKKKHRSEKSGDDGSKGSIGEIGLDGVVKLHPKLSSFISGIGFLSILGLTQKEQLVHNKKRLLSRFEEKQLNLWSNHGLIDPNGIGKIQWDLCIGLIIIYSLITIPFRIGFEITVDEKTRNLEYSIDVLFFIDLLLNFTTSYIDPMSERLILDRKRIIIEYLKFWFWIDIMSTIPFDSLFGTTSSNLKSVRLIRILRLMRLAKLARFIKLSKLNSHFEKLDINPALVNVAKIVFQIFFIAHLICCFWFYLTTTSITGIDQPALNDPSYPAERTWATEFGFEQQPIIDQYVAAFYWTIATMLAVGYGDIHATNNRERIYSIATMLCGGIMFGMVIAQVTRLIETRNPQAKAFKEKMDEIKAFLGEKNIPTNLRIISKEAYAYYLQKKSSLGESGTFDNLPRPLLIKLVRNIYEKEVNRIELFRHGFKRGHGSFICDLVMKCHPLYHTRGEIVYDTGDLADEMFFLVRGRVKIVDDNKTGSSPVLMGYCTEGNFFGELEFHQKTVRLSTTVAAYNSNLLSLKYADLRSALEEQGNLDAARHFNHTVSSRYNVFQTVVGSDASQSFVDSSATQSPSLSMLGLNMAGGRLERRPSLTNLAKVVLFVNGKLELQLKSSQVDDDAFFSAQDQLLRVMFRDPETNLDIITEETIDQLGRNRYVLHPRGRLKIYWDTFIGVLIVYSIIIIPVQIGFSNDGNQIVEHFVDACFFLDIVLSARTSYFSEEDDAWIISPSKIYANYVAGWFLIDLGSSMPFDVIFESFASSVTGLRSIKLLKTLRLTRLLKLVRLIKLGKYLNQLEDIFGISPSAFDLGKMVLEVVFIGHLVACMWWGLSDQLTSEAWFDNPNMVFEPMRNAPLSTKYITSLYWTFTTLATVGYGDITAINTSERVVAVFIMILGATVFGYIVANVSSLMGTLNQTEVKNNEKIAEVTEYLNEKNCPKMLAGAIIRHNKFKLSEMSAFDEDSIFSRLPKRISDEIQGHQYLDLIGLESSDSKFAAVPKIPLFNYISNHSIKLFLFKCLTSEYYDTNQYIVHKDEIASSISFLVSGRAMVYSLGERRTRTKKLTTSEVFTTRKKVLRNHSLVILDESKDWLKAQAMKAVGSINRSEPAESGNNLPNSNEEKNESSSSESSESSESSSSSDNDAHSPSKKSDKKKSDASTKYSPRTAALKLEKINTGKQPSKSDIGAINELNSNSQVINSNKEGLDEDEFLYNDSNFAPITDKKLSKSTNARLSTDYKEVDSNFNENHNPNISLKKPRRSFVPSIKEAMAGSVEPNGGAPRPVRVNSATKIVSTVTKKVRDTKDSSDEDEDFITLHNITDNNTLYSIMDNRMQNRGYRPMGELAQGDIVGYSAFLRRGRHLASVRAVEPCTVYTLSWKAIESIIDAQPSVALELQKALGQAVNHMSQDIGKMFAKQTRANFLERQKAKHVELISEKKGHAALEPTISGMQHIGRSISMAGPAWGALSEEQHMLKQQQIDYNTYGRKSHHHHHHHNHHSSVLENIPNSVLKTKFKPLDAVKSSASNAFGYLKSKVFPSDDKGHQVPEEVEIVDSFGVKRMVRVLKPNSKWRIVRKAIQDAKITAIVANMTENKSAIDRTGSTLTASTKNNAIKTNLFARAMMARVGESRIDQLLNKNTMNYDSDDEVKNDSLGLKKRPAAATSTVQFDPTDKLQSNRETNSSLSNAPNDLMKYKEEADKSTIEKMSAIRQSKLGRHRSYNDLLSVELQSQQIMDRQRKKQQNFVAQGGLAAKAGENLKGGLTRRTSFPSLDVESWRRDVKEKIFV